jgi:phosphoribosylformimino-5-aminoimidazole carboxamide ribotide isomerase
VGADPVRRVVEAVSIPVVAIAVATLDDVRRLEEAPAAVGVGTAPYEGWFTLREAQEAV